MEKLDKRLKVVIKIERMAKNEKAN